jgi:hypothetical protein
MMQRRVQVGTLPPLSLCPTTSRVAAHLATGGRVDDVKPNGSGHPANFSRETFARND